MTTRNIAHRSISLLVRVLAVLSAAVGFSFRPTLARLVAFILRNASAERYRVTLDNIRQSLPEISENDVSSIAKDSYYNFALCFLELLATPYLDDARIEQRFRYHNLELFESERLKQHPVIIVSAHTGNWEWGIQRLALKLKRPVICIAKPQRNPHVDRFVNRCRTNSWTRVVSMHSAARDILSQVQSNGLIAMLIDQAADPHRDVFVDFFGRPAVCFEAPASLALRYSTIIVSAFSRRTETGTYELFFEEVPIDDIRTHAYATQMIAQRCTSVLEAYIRKCPGQWSWQHKRWKYNPSDYPKRKQS